ncbi:3-dehydroquinate synthase family protein [Pelorhabdus rhamnosifermentans]|uniref:3-dehydroquinate synthase family protein n=1 Tax=Pelorhabdus rhamnosifermentans TaxID=2772457 RepID=UPI001C0628AB
MADEKESALRQVLNLGHTIGRSVEAISNYQLSHGEAVAIGLCKFYSGEDSILSRIVTQIG